MIYMYLIEEDSFYYDIRRKWGYNIEINILMNYLKLNIKFHD